MPMNYYEGNGICQYLGSCKEGEKFFWPKARLWLLVYGDENSNPKVLTVASERKLGAKAVYEEQEAAHMAQQIVQGTGIPVNFVRFDPDRDVQTFQYCEPEMNSMLKLSAEGLKDRFSQYGLKMNEKTAHKSINDKSSSLFHDWQRKSMGDSVTVADIDLIRHKDNEPTEIIELKRSYIEIETWEPYQRDYKNFILLSKLARKRNLKFYIVYNRRIKEPFFDDVSTLKIFEFDSGVQPNCQFKGLKTIEQFAENTAEGQA